LAARGAVISLAARRKDKLNAPVKELVSAGGKAQACACDVTKKEQVNAVVNSTVKDHGKLDVIGNNAGIMPIRQFWNAIPTNGMRWWTSTSRAVLYGIAGALPVFVHQNSGQFSTILCAVPVVLYFSSLSRRALTCAVSGASSAVVPGCFLCRR
jgi:NADP-dependent 3-hydroxy acid dehydrogenase YdfG